MEWVYDNCEDGNYFMCGWFVFFKFFSLCEHQKRE